MTKNDKADPATPARRALRAQIDENLRRVYDAALQEDMPDRFKDLLAQLQARDAEGKGEQS
ncbi:MAG: hypothetical protein MUE52_05420 [Tabrizicola sp.]|jgi:hypothetical protein|nr:hypothetical protein [Tabrizicola sp.]